MNKSSSKSDKIEHLLEHFESFISLSDELRAEIEKRISHRRFKKGELVLDVDQVCTESYFIKEGILRLYLIKDEKEISEYFCSKGEWVNSPLSFIQQEKDIYYIDAIEACECYSISARDLVYLFDHYPEMERYSRLSMGTIFGHMMARMASIRFTTAKEKYDHFCESYREIYHRIPLGMLASYLGITAETLSRIRKQR